MQLANYMHFCRVIFSFFFVFIVLLKISHKHKRCSPSLADPTTQPTTSTLVPMRFIRLLGRWLLGVPMTIFHRVPYWWWCHIWTCWVPLHRLVIGRRRCWIPLDRWWCRISSRWRRIRLRWWRIWCWRRRRRHWKISYSSYDKYFLIRLLNIS